MNVSNLWRKAMQFLSVGDCEGAALTLLDCCDICPPNQLIQVTVDKEDLRWLADMMDSAISFHDPERTKSKTILTPQQQANLESWFRMFWEGQNPNPCE